MTDENIVDFKEASRAHVFARTESRVADMKRAFRLVREASNPPKARARKKSRKGKKGSKKR